MGEGREPGRREERKGEKKKKKDSMCRFHVQGMCVCGVGKQVNFGTPAFAHPELAQTKAVLQNKQ